MQNPTASILPLDRRQALLALARQYNVAIFEDECYADLLWDGVEAPPALYALDPGLRHSLGSFSKSLAPALRLGYVIAGWEIMSRLLPLERRQRDRRVGPDDCRRIFLDEFRSTICRHLNGVLREKLDTMTEAVAREFGSDSGMLGAEGRHFPVDQAVQSESTCVTWSNPRPTRGLFSIPVRNGRSAPHNSSNCLRLCFAMPSKQTIRDGVAELARVCYEQTGIPLRSGNVTRD